MTALDFKNEAFLVFYYYGSNSFYGSIRLRPECFLETSTILQNFLLLIVVQVLANHLEAERLECFHQVGVVVTFDTWWTLLLMVLHLLLHLDRRDITLCNPGSLVRKQCIWFKSVLCCSFMTNVKKVGSCRMWNYLSISRQIRKLNSPFLKRVFILVQSLFEDLGLFLLENKKNPAVYCITCLGSCAGYYMIRKWRRTGQV